MCMLAVVVIVNLSTLMHYQCTNLWYSFIAYFRYRLICKSLIFARFLAIEMELAYMLDSLYASIYGKY